MGKPNRRRILWGGGLALVGSGSGTPQRNVNCNCASGSDGMPLDTGTSKIRPVMERYEVELRDLNRLFALPDSPVRHIRLEISVPNNSACWEAINLDVLSPAGKRRRSARHNL